MFINLNKVIKKKKKIIRKLLIGVIKYQDKYLIYIFNIFNIIVYW